MSKCSRNRMSATSQLPHPMSRYIMPQPNQSHLELPENMTNSPRHISSPGQASPTARQEGSPQMNGYSSMNTTNSNSTTSPISRLSPLSQETQSPPPLLSSHPPTMPSENRHQHKQLSQHQHANGYTNGNPYGKTFVPLSPRRFTSNSPQPKKSFCIDALLAKNQSQNNDDAAIDELGNGGQYMADAIRSFNDEGHDYSSSPEGEISRQDF